MISDDLEFWGVSEIGAVVLPSPRPSPTGEGVDVQAAFEPFWGFESSLQFFQVARGGRGQHIPTLRRDWRFHAGYGLLVDI